MANTVNDVMNVIASPDYGIKSIAGTNHEILAILQGTSNSNNNIHKIVDDVKNLLQKLVDTTTESKPVEISGGDSIKINSKHIKNILDETKNIRKSIDNLAKAFIKQGKIGNTPAVAKLSDKASQKVADAMVKSMEKQNKGGGMAALVDAFTKLKDISIKDIILGNMKLKRITKVFETAKDKLKIKKKDLDNIIKFVNAAPEMIESLRRVSWRVNRIIRSNVIQKLSDIFIGSGKEPSLLKIARSLEKEKSTFENANKASKEISVLISTLNKSMMKLLIASLLSKIVPSAIKSLKTVIDKILPLARKLTTNQELFNKAAASAKKLNALVGNLLLTTMSLTVIAVTGLPSMLGALFLKGVVKLIIPITKELSRNNRSIGKAVGTAVILTAAIGLMTITSLLLAEVAKTGISAILGSIIMFGVIKINIFTFKSLKKASRHVIMGSITMAIMSVSLLLFGIALGKISDATKKLSWKQLAMLGTTTVGLGVVLAVLGIPVVGALVAFGSIVLGVMSLSLLTFAISLKTISDLGEIPTKTLQQTLDAMTMVRKFFAKNALSIRAISGAKNYNKMMKPFGEAIENLVKLKELGSIPMKLVQQTLDAMKAIATFYKDNPIDKEIKKQAKLYKKMLKPFGKALKSFVKLKELGSIPMKLVQQTLDAMKTIATFYKDNPIDKKIKKQAKLYKEMLNPFGKTLKHFAKLKEIGSIPSKLIQQTLDAMSKIANYYKDNPIEKEVVKQSKRYKNMLKPFGKALKSFDKLKKIGSIPTQLISQALSAMKFISDFYSEQDVSVLKSIESNNIAIIMNNMINGFAQSSKSLNELKDIQSVPNEAIRSTSIALIDIFDFFEKSKIRKKYAKNSKYLETIVNKFIVVANNISKNIQELKNNTFKNVKLASRIISHIIKLFNKTKIKKNYIEKSTNIETIVNKFISISNNILNTTQEFTLEKFNSVKTAVASLKHIVKFFKQNGLNNKQIERSNAIINILTTTTNSISTLSNIDSSNITTIGNSIVNTLDGVNKVDIGNVKAVTNMFKAFNGINKSESIIKKFTESVDKFTESCKNLMEALNYNTDVISNFETTDSNASPITNTKEKINNFFNIESNDDNRTNRVSIENVDEIARTIANKINGALSIDIPDTQVQLLINGTGGNEWTISRY